MRMRMRSRVGRNLNVCLSKMMRPVRDESPMRDHETEHDKFKCVDEYDNHKLELECSELPEPAELATAFASRRFFLSSPGHSNSIVPSHKHTLLFTDTVAVPTYSPDPYVDFRRSMEDMVEARPHLRNVKDNWQMLEDLLLCYLALNPHTTHNFILSAFADLLLSLIPPSPSPGCYT